MVFTALAARLLLGHVSVEQKGASSDVEVVATSIEGGKMRQNHGL
jgi:hypothetical protein